jgi:hypothetical protein
MKKRYPFLPENWLRFGLTAVFAALSLNIHAQNAPAKQWDKTFGGSDIDFLKSTQQTSDGGYILSGHSMSPISGDKSQINNGPTYTGDYWIVKLDASGNKLWDKTFGGNNDDRLFALQQTSDGGYILGGHSDSGISGDKTQASKGNSDYWVVKLDVNGNKLWDKTLGGNGPDVLTTLQQTAGGGYMVGGYSSSGIGGDKSQSSINSWDYWILKLDASGNKIWDKTFGGSDSEELRCLKQTSDGGYILGGESNSGISGDKSQPNKGSGFTTDYWIVKLDPNGNKLWDKTFGGNDWDHLYDLQQTLDGGYIFGGNSWSGNNGDKTQNSHGLNDYWIVKIDASGNKLWDKAFGGSGYDELTSIQQTSNGEYILGGASTSGLNGDKTQASAGGTDFWILKLNTNGNKLWDKSLGGSNNESLSSLRLTSDGGCILGGPSDSGLNGDKTQASKGGQDYWIVKLAADITGLKETEANSNLSISPNPNQGKFTLKLNNLTAPTAEVTVTDLLGRVVLRKEIQTTNNRLSEELTLPNAKGMYLLQVKAGEQILSRKIVVE